MARRFDLRTAPRSADEEDEEDEEEEEEEEDEEEEDEGGDGPDRSTTADDTLLLAPPLAAPSRRAMRSAFLPETASPRDLHNALSRLTLSVPRPRGRTARPR